MIGSGGISKTEANINWDFSMHDTLPPEYLRMIANLRFPWTAEECWARIEEGLSFDEVKAYFDAQEEKIIRQEAHVWSLGNDTRQAEVTRLRAQAYDDSLRHTVQVRKSVGALLGNVQQWRTPTGKRRRNARMAARRSRAAAGESLSQVRSSWPPPRLGCCISDPLQCSCRKAAVSAGLVEEDKVK